MATSQTPRGRAAWLKGTLWLAGILTGIALALGALVVVLPTAAMFAPLRTAIAEQALAAVFATPVEIDGPVGFVLGPTVYVTGSDIRFLRPAGADDPDRIEQGEVGFDLQPLVAGRFQLTTLKLKGVTLAQNSKLVVVDTTAEQDDAIEQRLIGVLPSIIRLAGRADVDVSDVTYTYNNEKTGWVFDVSLAEFVNTRSAGSTTIKVNGQVNGTPVSIAGEIHTLPDGAVVSGEGFALTISSPGADIELRSVVPDDPDPVLRQILVSADVAAIGDVLDSFKIARTVEGTATVKTTIRSASGVASMRDLDANIVIDSGPTYKVTGTVSDLSARKGLDISIDATWEPDVAPGSAGGSQDEGLLSFELYEVNARLVGDLNALKMQDGWINTNLFSDAIPSLGPISATAVRRDAKGRIAVDGLRVLAGPADARTLDLTGQIGDLLQLADFQLQGDVSIPMATVLGIATSDAPLGQLSGKFAVSDAAGAAGIDTFKASISGSTLLEADLELKADQSHETQSASFNLTLDVPDYAKLATALALTPEAIGALKFKGSLSVQPQGGDIDGELSFGKTVVTGDLTLKAEGNRPLISGKIATPLLVLADARRMFQAGRGFAQLRKSAIDAAASAAAAASGPIPRRVAIQPKLDFEVSAARIDAAGSDVSGLTGRFGFDDGTATAQSVNLKFRRGAFNFDGHMNLRDKSRPFSVKGRMDNWPIGDVFKALAIDLPVEGVLRASFDVASTGTNVPAAIGAARGRTDMRITNGSIGNRLLDLTGLDLPSWLIAPSAKSGVSRLECFDAKITFDPGQAVVRSAVAQTDDVVVTASGRIDFKADTINIEAVPRALRPNLVPIVSPFEITGKLSAPKVVLKGGVVGRGVAETLALPLNTLGALLGVDKATPESEAQAAEKGC